MTHTQTQTQTPLILATSVAAILLSAGAAHAQFTTPNIVTDAGAVQMVHGTTLFINHGIQGVGRISGSALDSFGETFGSVSGLQITNWAGGSGTYSGTFHILPDRGFNTDAGFFAGYASRIQQVNFSFTPYTSGANIGGVDIESRIAAQNQIVFTSAISGVKFTYLDPNSSTVANPVGLDPAAGSSSIFGTTVPYVIDYTGLATPTDSATTTFAGINRLALDSEALVLKPDGSGYIGDEYGASIYYFDANKQIIGVITPPAALQPRDANGNLNFGSLGAPASGRRNNQGMEGVALSPDGTRLFGLLQSAAVQDSNSAQQNRRVTRLLIYDVSGVATPSAPVAEYAIDLPTLTQNGQGGPVNRTAAQSEIVAIDDHRLLILSRDGNGLGNPSSLPSMYKSILFVDLNGGGATNFAGTAADAAGGKITSAPGVINPSITPLSWAEAVNMLNSTQLGKFNIEIDTAGLPGGSTQATELTLGEKWEGMSLVSANDPSAPDDYFLFVANDNDFLTSQGIIAGPDGTPINYDAWTAHDASRVPPPVGTSTANENDTMFIAYRVTIATIPEPGSAMLLGIGALALLARRRRRAARTAAFVVPLCGAMLLGSPAQSDAVLVLNEIFLNPPSTDNTQEFIEVLSTSGGIESMAGLTLISVEGDGTAAGNIDFALNLGAFSTGANGLFLWRDSALALNPPPHPDTTINIADWPVNGTAFSGDLENGSQTFLLVSGFSGALNQDLDTNNDGTLDATPWTTVVDAIGFLENDGAANQAYADDLGFLNVGPSPTFNADALLRDSATLEWLATDVLGTNPGGPYTADPTPGRAGFVATGTEPLTPGSANFTLVPEPGCAALLAAAGALLLGSRRRTRNGPLDRA
jgi:hypothetical protein